MAIKVCENGHFFDTGSGPACPRCSAEEMHDKDGNALPNMGRPAFRALRNAGIVQLADLANYTEHDLLALHGFGPKALRILHHALAEHGMSFAKK